MNEKILIIEDDSIIQTELKTLLSSNGYQVHTVQDFKNAAYEVEQHAPHLILLDINLPYEDGFKICSKIRLNTNAPIIFVTSRISDMDELNSIMLGGDAFITKPYHTAILLAKISSLLKRAYGTGQTEVLSYKNVSLHLENSTLAYGEQRVDLTKNELSILYYLFTHQEQICPRSDIIEYLWDNRLYVDDNALSVNITRIRKKLDSIGLQDFITTKHRQGYII